MEARGRGWELGMKDSAKSRVGPQEKGSGPGLG